MTFEKILAEDGKLIYSTKGNSMHPMIREGRNRVVIKPVTGRLKLLDIPLYKRKNGQYVLHRIIRVRKNDYVLCGDNQYIPEYGISDDQIIGVLAAVFCNGREEPVDSFKWRAFALVWFLLFPLRAFIGMCRAIPGKSFFSHSVLICFLRTCVTFIRKKKYKKFHDRIDKVLSDFETVPSASIKWCLIYDRYRYKIDPSEYFLFGFARLNAKGKREYIGSHERKELVKRLSGPREERKHVSTITRNKYLTYLLLQDYYRREVILLNKEEDYDLFADLLHRKGKVILKPQGASLGEDVRLVSLTDIQDTRAYYDDLLNVRSWLAEEVVVQTEEMAGFHPKSVNTVRLMTLLFREEVVFLLGCFRMGVGNSIVDNFSHGGLGAAIDVDTGIVISAGMNKKGHSFLFHPDTGKQIIGFAVPRYEELKNLTEKLAHLMPEVNCIAWDFALTADGWCLIEANSSGHLTSQAWEKKGYRQMFEQYYLQ